MQRATRMLLLLAVTTLVWAPGQARAEGFISPFVGVIMGNQPAEGGNTFGFSAGYMGAGVIGSELDFGYAPDIFEEVIDNHAITVMGNLILGIPIGGTRGAGLRPYVTGGLGLIRTGTKDLFGSDVTVNDLGVNLGGGVMGFFADHFGLRADARYFRNVTSDLNDADADPEFALGDLDFWRASVGIVIR